MTEGTVREGTDRGTRFRYRRSFTAGTHRSQEDSMRRIGKVARVLRSICVMGGIALSLLMAVPAWSAEGGKDGKGTHIKVSGVVTKVHPSHVTIKTPWGQMTIAAAAGPQNLKEGE